MAPRAYPVGAEVMASGVHFRVWAPEKRRLEVVLEGAGSLSALEAEGNGYFSGVVHGMKAGALYRFRVDGEGSFPDPASRFQPDGPHGPSEVIDPRRYLWRDSEWKGVEIERQVLYELHIGTSTREGTWGSAARALSALRG